MYSFLQPTFLSRYFFLILFYRIDLLYLLFIIQVLNSSGFVNGADIPTNIKIFFKSNHDILNGRNFIHNFQRAISN